MSRAHVETFAQTVRDTLPYSTGAGLTPLLMSIGGRISYKSPTDPEAEAFSLIARSHHDFEIILSPHTSIDRDNFSIAHDLGHLAMHFSNANAPMRATRLPPTDEVSTRTEWEANWFAAGFLMPEIEFADLWKRHNANARLIAAHFNVSIRMASLRASMLKLEPAEEIA